MQLLDLFNSMQFPNLRASIAASFLNPTYVANTRFVQIAQAENSDFSPSQNESSNCTSPIYDEIGFYGGLLSSVGFRNCPFRSAYQCEGCRSEPILWRHPAGSHRELVVQPVVLVTTIPRVETRNLCMLSSQCGAEWIETEA